MGEKEGKGEGRDQDEAIDPLTTFSPPSYHLGTMPESYTFNS
jgi:hypothetical protein